MKALWWWFTSLPHSQKIFLTAAILLFTSWMMVRSGILIGERTMFPADGYPKANEIQSDLFRFDSTYYKDIAENGYSYDGNPSSSPNIVFAPLFPLLVRGFSELTTLNPVTVGFAINKVLLYGALVFLLFWLDTFIGLLSGTLVLFALTTAAGAYSLHAFYSESLTLFLIAITLWAQHERRLPLMALSAMLLGASRLTALPMALVSALWFLRRAYLLKFTAPAATTITKPSSFSAIARLMCYSLVCLLGGGAYLGYIGYEFGNPFTLLPEIQSTSWASFHPPTSWLSLLTGKYLISYALFAIGKGGYSFMDILTLNLAWTVLALLSCIYVLRKWPRQFFSYFFFSYFLFIYVTNTSSPFLISAHRFFVLMLPIFLMFRGLSLWLSLKNRWVGAGVAIFLLALNFAYGLFHTAYFNQGVWFYF